MAFKLQPFPCKILVLRNNTEQSCANILCKNICFTLNKMQSKQPQSLANNETMKSERMCKLLLNFRTTNE